MTPISLSGFDSSKSMQSMAANDSRVRCIDYPLASKKYRLPSLGSQGLSRDEEYQLPFLLRLESSLVNDALKGQRGVVATQY